MLQTKRILVNPIAIAERTSLEEVDRPSPYTYLGKHDTHSQHGQKCGVRTLFLTGPYHEFRANRLALLLTEQYVISLLCPTYEKFCKFAGIISPSYYFYWKISS